MIVLRFGMLKAWAQNQSLAEIEIEERYRTWVANLRTDKYVTVRTLSLQSSSCSSFDFVNWYCFVLFCPQVTLFQLQKIYGKSGEAKAFIQELTKGALFAAPAIVTESCFQKSPTTCWSTHPIQGKRGFRTPRPGCVCVVLCSAPLIFCLSAKLAGPQQPGGEDVQSAQGSNWRKL